MRHQSNCGGQHGNEAPRLLATDQSIVISISKASKIGDNKAMNSFSSSLEMEQAGCSTSAERATAEEPACQII